MRVSKIEAVDGEAQGPGEVAGPALRVSIEVQNTSGKDVAMDLALTNLYYGKDKTPASALSGPGVRPLPGTIASGDRASGQFVFGVPDGAATLSSLSSACGRTRRRSFSRAACDRERAGRPAIVGAPVDHRPDSAVALDLRATSTPYAGSGAVCVLCTVLGVLAAGALTLTIQPRYETRTTFFVVASTGTGTSPLQADEFAQRRINSYVGVVRSENMAAEIVVRDTGLDLTPERDPGR